MAKLPRLPLVKKLPLPPWVRLDFKMRKTGFRSGEASDFVEDPLLPVYSDGWYYDRGTQKEWYCVDGKAYRDGREKTPGAMFKFDLSVTAPRILRDEELHALQTLIKNGFPLPKETMKIYDDFMNWRQRHSFATREHRANKKAVAQIRKRFQALKAARGL